MMPVRTKIFSKSTIVTVLIWTSIITYAFFDHFHFIKSKYFVYILAAVEVSFMIYFIYKINKILAVYKIEKTKHYYMDEALHCSIKKVFGSHPILKLLFSEISIFLYAFLGWMIKPNISNGILFSYYKTTLYKVFFWVMLISTIISIPVFHLLLMQWHPVVAWTVTLLTIYTLFWLFGDYSMIKNKPIIVTDNELIIRIGSRWKVDIDISNIETIQNHILKNEEEYIKLTVLNEENVYMSFHEPIQIEGLFGIHKRSSEIALYIDNASDFINIINQSVLDT